MASKIGFRQFGVIIRRTPSIRLTPFSRAYQIRLSSTSSSPPPPKPSNTRRNILLLTLLTTTTYIILPTINPQPQTLNETTFVPYTITSRTSLSPSSFVLTVVPDTPNPNPPYFLPGSNRWRHPLWSVEFKQPEVQISRHYTPLPPLTNFSSLSEGEGGGEKDGALRFYIRAVGDGEMSRYLSRLRESQKIHIRGPHIGFDLVHRLGSRKLLVFLAGGTGVVPGMQAARVALDGYDDAKVSLLWAVRSRGEIMMNTSGKTAETKDERAWWDWGDKQPQGLHEGEGLSPVARQLVDMKKMYGERFSVRISVDEEDTFFKKPHIQQALTSISSEDAISKKHPGMGCSLHDQRLHVGVSEFETEKPTCACEPMNGALPGKNLFIVSGPDGFVGHYAGGKVWKGGMQTQGAIGGVAGEIQRKNPQLKDDWLVLKL